MIKEITLKECPKKLQEEVARTQKRLNIEIIGVKRYEPNEYNKSVTYKVYTEFGTEFGIYTMSVGNSCLDNEVKTHFISVSDIETLQKKSSWFDE